MKRTLLFLALLLCFACSDKSSEPVKEPEAGKETVPVVSLSEAALANARIKIDALVESPKTSSAVFPAQIALDPRRHSFVSAVTSGQIERIHVRSGDKVKAGGTLATVISPDLGEAVGNHLAASARLEAARAKRDRLRALLTDGVSAKSQVAEAEADLTVAAAEAEAAEERLHVFGVTPESIPKTGEHFTSRFPVRSPIDGVVLSADVSVGKAVSGGEQLFHVGDLDEVWLLVNVDERSLGGVKAGAAVTFTLDAYGDEEFKGLVEQVGGWLDPATRTAEVRLVIPNPQHRLKPNMFAKAHLALSTAQEASTSALIVPGTAVQTIEGKTSIFVEVRPRTFEVRRVVIETMQDGRAVLVAGARAGERVAVEGAFTLKSELAKSELEGE